MVGGSWEDDVQLTGLKPLIYVWLAVVEKNETLKNLWWLYWIILKSAVMMVWWLSWIFEKVIVIGGLEKVAFHFPGCFKLQWTSLTMTSFENLNDWGENVNRHRHITNYKEVWVTVFSHFQLAGTGRVSRFMSQWYQISIRYRYKVWNTYPGWWFGTMEFIAVHILGMSSS